MNNDQMFAPLVAYLQKNRIDEMDHILSYMMFMHTDKKWYQSEVHYYYKNSMTRRYAVIKESGKLAEEEPGSLAYIED